MGGSSNDTINNGMDFVAAHIKPLQAMVARMCNAYRRPDLAEDMFCDAIVGNCDRAYNKFDSSINDDLSGWMYSQFQWYCRKWFAKHCRRADRETQFTVLDDSEANEVAAITLLADSAESIVSALSRYEEVIGLLGELSDYEKRLIRLHYGYDNSFEEIADKIGGAPSTLRIHCNAAIAKLQRRSDKGRSNG